MKIIRKRLITLSSILPGLIIGGFLFIPLILLAGKGAWTYTNKSEFCISCHVMKGEYKNWTHSSHRNWAGCTDCHESQKNIVTKLTGKLKDGIYHGYAYLLNKDPVLIRISKHGGDTVMSNCVRCHEQLVASILHNSERKCWECHRGIAHGY